jgi:hypothetical protein
MLKISIAILLTAISATRAHTANVVSTYETDNNVVSVIETSDGNIWEVGDELDSAKSYTVTFDTNGTPNVTDDLVIAVKECE